MQCIILKQFLQTFYKQAALSKVVGTTVVIKKLESRKRLGILKREVSLGFWQFMEQDFSRNNCTAVSWKMFVEASLHHTEP